MRPRQLSGDWVRRLSTAALLMLTACAAGSSNSESKITGARVIVRAEVGSGVSLGQSRVEPTTALLGMTTAADQLDLEVRPGSASITVHTPGACALEVAVAGAQPGSITRATVKPWLSAAGGDLTQIGFDAPFVVTLTPGCREALTSKVEWKQTGGAPVEISTEQGGLVVRGRTPAFNAPPKFPRSVW